MPISASTSDLPKRIEYLRGLQSMRIKPSVDGSVNHDSLIFLAGFACGLSENIFHASGAIRCSGATPAQIAGVIDLLAHFATEQADVESFPRVVTEKLGIGVAANQAFPVTPPSQPVQTNIFDAEIQDTAVIGQRAHAQEEKILNGVPKSQNGPITTLIMVVVGLLVFAVFLGFFLLWVREGWSAASQKNPVGSALVFIVFGVIYLLTIPVFKDKGYPTLSKAMLWIAITAGALFSQTCKLQSSLS